MLMNRCEVSDKKRNLIFLLGQLGSGGREKAEFLEKIKRSI